MEFHTLGSDNECHFEAYRYGSSASAFLKSVPMSIAVYFDYADTPLWDEASCKRSSFKK